MLQGDALKFLKSGVFFVLLILLDQLTKRLANNTYLNFNFAFSFKLPVWLIFSIYLFVLLVMINYCRKNYHKFSIVSWLAWTLIFAGAASNVFERAILGSVRDFIYVHLGNLTGIYNLADSYIILGIVILICHGLTTNNGDLK